MEPSTTAREGNTAARESSTTSREASTTNREANAASRRTEDIALDLLKFVAAQANVGGKAAGSAVGFGIPASSKPDDQVAHLLELYAKCREAVEK